nr:unnamed protein product [Callosobruchus chinensis]
MYCCSTERKFYRRKRKFSFRQSHLRNNVSPGKISFNASDTSGLSYVIFPEYNIKILIDSGSTRSFIDPEIAFNFFPNQIRNEPFIVSTVFQKSAHKFSALVPASKIFCLPQPKQLKFYLFKFHDVFNGLIGLDNHKELEASLNYSDGFLVTPHARIKLLYQKTNNNLNFISIEPRTERVIKVRTSIQQGEIIIPHQKFHNCEIPECLTIAKNGYALTTLLNNTTETVTLDLSEPL